MLLLQFGDTVGRHFQVESLQRCLRQDIKPQECLEEASKLQLYSSKHKALYLYAYRLVKPIWEMKITNYPRIEQLSMQKFNLDYMLPVKDKLVQFYEFIQANDRDLIGSTCQNRHLLPDDSKLVMLENLDLDLKEFI